MSTEEALKMAIKALEEYQYADTDKAQRLCAEALEQCKSALSELENSEPVLKVSNNGTQLSLTKPNGDYWDMSKHIGEAFYSAPPKHQWIGLSDKEIELAYVFTLNQGVREQDVKQVLKVGRAIESKLKELNHE